MATTTTINPADEPKAKIEVSESNFPPVEFNTTLHDLFLDGDKGPLEDTYCVVKANSDRQYGKVVPLNEKYIIHSAQVSSADDLAHLCLEINCYLLLLYAGKMKVAFIGSEGATDDKTLHKQAVSENARRSFSVLNEAQRPRVSTYANIEDFIQNHDGSNIRWAFAMDFAERLPSVDHPELVYKLNSKRWLAHCSLKSANDTIIDCQISCPEHMTESNLWYYGGKDCRLCGSGVETELHRVRSILLDRPPYVLKLTQSLSSVGTLLVKNEKERKEVVDQAEKYLREYLPRVTKENAHLRTTSLILSDFIPGETMALNFFIRKNGSVVFLGACHQLATGESGRQATAITYAEQEKLQDKYQSTLDMIGQALHEEGYYGPVGADIMENPDDGTLFTIDANVRSPLSFVLYLLRGHLNEKRGFAMSLVYECIMLTLSRDEFERDFNKELHDARIILIGSTRLGEKEQWAHGMVVAGNSQKEIDELSDRILKFEIEGGQGGDLSDAAA
ncbi:hypothetical protein HII31_12119 [Pseudocercospora fuligena]|uniref:ATP-grasp domain-containing protein n=1 Tax=Pseudocercospora fuligena TaxID=685502 RepID=A0A8H6RAN2_9PEZI|nr:hypothetical protein HII31_12119 [Pseudocercospora fuligena]